MTAPQYEISVWERYATEFALAFADTPTRIRAVREAYIVHGFDVDLIEQISGFPIWRIRQVIRDGLARPH